MAEFISGVAVTVFIVFLFVKIKESKARKENTPQGSGGSSGGGADVPPKQRY